MAAPHVAGVVALNLGLNPALTPKQAETLIVESANSGLIDLACLGTTASCSKSPNLILHQSC